MNVGLNDFNNKFKFLEHHSIKLKKYINLFVYNVKKNKNKNKNF